MGYDDREKEALKPYLESYLNSKGINTRRLFSCILNPGAHKHGDAKPSMGFKDDFVKCFGCGAAGDIFTVIGELEHIPDFPGRVKFAQDFAGGRRTATAPISKPAAAKKKAPLVDYSEFYREARAAIHETDYWIKRGFSIDTIKAFGIGFCKAWRHPKRPWDEPTPRLIIPDIQGRGDCGYSARITRPGVKDSQRVGAWAIFNPSALTSGERVIVTEAPLDAISIFQARPRQVTSIGTAGNDKLLINALKAMKPEARPPSMVIAMDNDPGGQAAAERIAKGLTELKIPYSVIEDWGGKDE